MKMSLRKARFVLKSQGDLGDLLFAIGTVISSPKSSLDDIILGLRHPEVIAEQAALALYRRTGRPLPRDRADISTDGADWAKWIARMNESSMEGASRSQPPLRGTTHANPGQKLKSSFFQDLAMETGLSRKQVTLVLSGLSTAIKRGLANGKDVTIPGLIKFTVTKKPAAKARTVDNPFKPGERLRIAAKPARRVVKVRPLKALKEMV